MTVPAKAKRVRPVPAGHLNVSMMPKAYLAPYMAVNTFQLWDRERLLCTREKGRPGRRCYGLDPDWHPRPVDVWLQQPPTTAFVGCSLFHPIRVDLLQMFMPYMAGWVFGRCYLGKKAKPFEEGTERERIKDYLVPSASISHYLPWRSAKLTTHDPRCTRCGFVYTDGEGSDYFASR